MAKARGRVISPSAIASGLAALMVGRAVDMTYPRRFREPGATMLEVRGLSAATGVAVSGEVTLDAALKDKAKPGETRYSSLTPPKTLEFRGGPTRI